MDVKPYSEVFSSALPQRGSAVFLLQADQNLVLRFGHLKHILQHRGKGSTQMLRLSIYLHASHWSCGEKQKEKKKEWNGMK